VDRPATNVGQWACRQAGQPISVRLIPAAASDLASACERSQLNRADVVNRAISLYEFLDAERAAGAELRLHRADGSVFLMGWI
jgi:hypothetical protein